MNSSAYRPAKKQFGASTLPLIVFLSMAAVILTVAFKVYPIIYEHWQLENVIMSFQDESDLDSVTENELRKRFQVRLQTNNVRSFNTDENLFISLEDDVLFIEVEYENRVNIYRNYDVISTFKKDLEVIY